MDLLWRTSDDEEQKRRDALQQGKKIITVINETSSTIALGSNNKKFYLEKEQRKDVVLEDTHIILSPTIYLKDLKRNHPIIAKGLYCGFVSIISTPKGKIYIREIIRKHEYIKVINKSSKYATVTFMEWNEAYKGLGETEGEWSLRDVAIHPHSSIQLRFLISISTYEGKRVFVLDAGICNRKSLTYVYKEQEFEWLALSHEVTITVTDVVVNK